MAGFADAIVLAAGGSQRMNGFDKLHAVILDRPLVAWTLAAVAAAESVRKIVLVVRAEQVATIQQAYWVIEAGATVVAGGERRQESVAAGVEATDADIVLIHDGARPLATSALVDAVAAAVNWPRAGRAGLVVHQADPQLMEDAPQLAAADWRHPPRDEVRTQLGQTPGSEQLTPVDRTGEGPRPDEGPGLEALR